MRQHALRLSDELMQAVDSKRGDVPRNTWVVRAIEAQLSVEELAVQNTPTPKADRSPETDLSYAERKRLNGPEAAFGPPILHPQRSAKPPLQRPLVQKRGK